MFDAYLKVFTLNSRFFDALLKVPLCLGLATPKFLVQFEAKYLPQIAPEAVSEHEYVKISWGGHGQAIA